jgi:nucleotide-binding universal stress UspA family protein
VIENIIVTDDGTEVSDKALEIACEIAGPCDALIVLYHITACY